MNPPKRVPTIKLLVALPYARGWSVVTEWKATSQAKLIRHIRAYYVKLVVSTLNPKACQAFVA